ncbi:MAG: hypothetical protein AAGF85_19310 [Bacteroidota bacterium]
MNWPNDSTTAQQKFALYQDAFRIENYVEAIEPLGWLLKEAPGLHLSLYIHGEKMYKSLASSSTNDAMKLKYQLAQLELYDLRIQHFGQEAKILNRKAHAAYRYFRDNPQKYEELFELFEKIYFMGKNEILSANVATYMDVIRMYHHHVQPLSDSVILHRYELISSLIQEKNIDPKVQDIADRIVVKLVNVDCKFIHERFGHPFMQDPSSVNLAKKVVRLSLAYGCKKSPSFYLAAQKVQQNQPSYSLGLLLAVLSDKRGKPAKAEGYYKEALNLTSEPGKKASILYALAVHYQNRKMKSLSRKYALKALTHDSGFLKSYELVGDLFFSSAEECKEGKSRVNDRSIYIAAYDMYKKAKAVDKMKMAIAQFPSMDNIFNEVREEGEVIHVGCWVNETVILQKRPRTLTK